MRQRTGARWAVFSGLPPMHILRAVPHPLRWYLGRYAAWLDAAVREWTGERGPGLLPAAVDHRPGRLADDGFHPGPRLYPHGRKRLAQIIVKRRDRWAGQP